ncbi:beta-trefoil DNA-binding domain-containing protein [Gilbertella persicaria]|uniref:beta-trefoil DNA-binding domain-containing protein n=1 Tax=Gilbertella persicaria TaxID=101096 RepID=UPI002220A000|nr:beta-trefoil DNA-binding domain-containing protein [Gilbertella persicaria]KAI8098199.1 beta-trefoil DNA-binding domain-containing protein [Gilbertella persicaria]
MLYRFLCPPPTAILVGTNWWTSSTSFNTNENEVLKLPDGSLLFPPKLTVSISGEAVQSGHIEWSTVSGTTVGQTGQHLIKASTSGACSNTPSEHPSRFRSSADVRNQPIELYNNQAQELLGSGKSVSKHLYINDADEKRKRVEAIVRIQLANGLQLGAFTSKGIKVISKPSKKRQSAKNMELCIHHGTTVSLFNRIRSQTVSTKYLGVSASPIPGQPARMENTCFVARTTSWDPFVIWLVNNEENSHSSLLMGDSLVDLSDHLPPPPAIAMKRQQMIPIHYNQHVVLQCLTTGLVSPVMILRKVDKASTVVGGTLVNDEEVLGDPVSQLHKVALQIVAPTNEPPTYLACLNDMVGMHKITEPRKPVVIEESTMAEKIVRKRRVSIDPVEDMFSRKSSISSNSSTNTRRSSIQAGLGACWQEDVSDAAVWTIVGTDCTTYSFMLPTQSLFEEQDEPTDNTVLNTTFPFLLNLSIKSPTVLHLHGENFSRDLQVWFGDLKLTTEYRSRELLVCQMPSQQELLHVKEAYHQIPVLFVRGDGTLCKTNKFYPL